MGLRTASDIEAEYTAVRTAYLKALEAESFTIAGQGSRSVTRAEVHRLRKQMQLLEKEYNRINSGGIKVRGVTPVR